MTEYGSWTAIATAAKAVASARSKDSGPDVGSQLTSFRFDRFLSRVFEDREDSEWLLKGGSSMLARVPRARGTKDVDLAAATGSLDDAEAALRRTVERDFGDHITFELASSRPTGRGNDQPGVETRRLVFTCRDAATGRKVGDVPVDIVVGHAPVGEIETIEPTNRVHLPKSVPSAPYRLYPIADQVADKVCATMSTYAGKPSSRVKDLVDLVVIARTQRIDIEQLQAAITAKRDLSGLDPFQEFTSPEAWARTYRALAASTPAAGGITDVDEARDLVSAMVNPALADTAAAPSTWVPDQGWISPDEAEKTSTTVEEGPGGTVHVRSHTRAGRPVKEHQRAPRTSGSAQ